MTLGPPPPLPLSLPSYKSLGLHLKILLQLLLLPKVLAGALDWQVMDPGERMGVENIERKERERVEGDHIHSLGSSTQLNGY